MTKTNAMRLLDAAKKPYKIKTYVPNEDNVLPLDQVGQLDMIAEQVFKTLVTKNEKNIINVFCVPLNCELDLKKAAKISSSKKVEMVHVKDILKLTGYVRGGCSPIGMKKKYATFIDETAILFDEIGISAGLSGNEIVIEPNVLCEFVQSEFCDLTKEQ
ncbi:MAG: Cys-tRNA(Pro) deacylase [Clostridia bacterium]